MKTKLAIMNLLKLTEMEYAVAVERFGYSYARYYCSGCESSVAYVTRTSSFWKWWMRHFDIRDEIFLHDYLPYAGTNTVNTLREYWNETHQPEVVEGKIPDHTWQNMLAKIDDELQKSGNL